MNEILFKRATIFGIDFAVRDIALAACVFLWIGNMVLRTGFSGVQSLLDAALFIGLLLVVTAATRTVSWRLLLSMFLLGGCNMVLVAMVSNAIFPASGFLSPKIRPIVVPLLEEIGFLAPFLVMLWRRKGVSYTLGASDILLMTAVCGYGFALVEEACMRAHGDWGGAPFPFLPDCIIVGDRIFGYHLSNSQPVWAGLAGATIGLGLYLRHRKLLAWQVGVAGVFLGVIDHITNNCKAAINAARIGGSDIFIGSLSLLTWNGYLIPLLFIVATVGVVVVDLILIRRLPQSFHPATMGNTWMQRWQSMLDLRRLAFAHYYCQHLSGSAKEDAEALAGYCFFRNWNRSTSQSQLQMPSKQQNESPAQANEQAIQPSESAAQANEQAIQPSESAAPGNEQPTDTSN